jgi:hypothetical protein
MAGVYGGLLYHRDQQLMKWNNEKNPKNRLA